MRSIFDIIGPVMVGPSSSHTAGAVRLGLIARNVLGEDPRAVSVGLHGSFAQTYKGHGTDKAIIAGLMGFSPDDMRIRDSLAIAQARDINYEFHKVELADAHPNTAVFSVIGGSGRKIKMTGSSVGGGNIVVSEIDGYEVELTGRYSTLIIAQRDTPGMIARVTQLLADHSINVAFMRVARQERGADALMIIEVDDVIFPAIVEAVKKVQGINNAFIIPPL